MTSLSDKTFFRSPRVNKEAIWSPSKLTLNFSSIEIIKAINLSESQFSISFSFVSWERSFSFTSNTSIDYVLTWSNNDKTFTINPTGDLNASTTYYISISGETLAGVYFDYSYSFSTSDSL